MTTTTPPAGIVGKIRKLLALAESDNENEAAVAGRIADKLMREHAVSMATLDEAALLEADPVGVEAFEVGQSTWKVTLAWTLAAHCGVSAIRGVRYGDAHPTKVDDEGHPVPLGAYKRRVFAIAYGHRSDLEVWEYLYTVALREIEAAAKFYRADEADLGYPPTRTQMTAFREGAVNGLGAKLYEQRRAGTARAAAGTALAVQSRADRADREKNRVHPKLGTYTGGVGGSSAGREAGRKISIGTGIGAKRSRMIA